MYGELNGVSLTCYASNYRYKTPTLKCGLKNDHYTKSDTALGNGKLLYHVGL